MRITVIEDTNGNTSSVFDTGWIVTYSNESGEWIKTGKFENIVPKASGMAGIRSALAGIVDQIKGKIIVASEISGIAFSVFEAAGFISFTAQAPAADVLDIVKAEVDELAKAKQEEKADIRAYLRQDMKSGNCFLDLQKMLAENPQLTTKSTLLPYLKEGKFARLDIVFGHIPPWFDTELKALGLSYETVDARENKKVIRIIRAGQVPKE